MKTISVGALVKINPEIFGEKCNPQEMYGKLGYIGIFKNAIWKVSSITNDTNRGMCAWVSLTNAEELMKDLKGVKSVTTEGEAFILLEDLVHANTKVTLNYILSSTVKTKTQMIADLFEDRRKLKACGLSRIQPEMIANWKQIRILRGELKGTIPLVGEASVYLPKQRITMPLHPSDVPDESEESIKTFKRLLVDKLRVMRLQRRVINEDKFVFGLNVKYCGGTFVNSGELLKAYESSLTESLNEYKKPSDPNATYVGVEVEFIYSGNDKDLRQLLIKNRLHKNVRVEGDGSLRACHNSGYSTAELQIIAKTTELESVMSRLEIVLNNPLIDGYANRSCGTHVHLDMRNRDYRSCFRNLVRVQDILRGAQPIGRLKNTHCKPNKSDDFGSENNRYLVVNPNSYEKHTTIEIRIHEGTVDVKGIVNWAMFLDSIASCNVEIPVNKFRTARELVAATNILIPADSLSYVDSRIDKFQSVTIAHVC
jgi:hypothetical protein